MIFVLFSIKAIAPMVRVDSCIENDQPQIPSIMNMTKGQGEGQQINPVINISIAML